MTHAKRRAQKVLYKLSEGKRNLGSYEGFQSIRLRTEDIRSVVRIWPPRGGELKGKNGLLFRASARVQIMESSILAQNERWRRVLSMQVERYQQWESGGRVSNTWVICLSVGDSLWKHRIIPDAMVLAQAGVRKGAKAPLRDEPAPH